MSSRIPPISKTRPPTLSASIQAFIYVVLAATGGHQSWKASTGPNCFNALPSVSTSPVSWTVRIRLFVAASRFNESVLRAAAMTRAPMVRATSTAASKGISRRRYNDGFARFQVNVHEPTEGHELPEGIWDLEDAVAEFSVCRRSQQALLVQWIVILQWRFCILCVPNPVSHHKT
jgi:hypothetical protein